MRIRKVVEAARKLRSYHHLYKFGESLLFLWRACGGEDTCCASDIAEADNEKSNSNNL
jgi:hypothetical protein